ncbi:hypothetical protein RYX36_028336 [Vicia faba]
MVDQIESCSPNTLVQCRICHDEDEDLNMDTPCSCSGTLQYAHRICVQRWCNEKGDTTCEICQQQFKGYTAPQAPLFHYRGSPLFWIGVGVGFSALFSVVRTIKYAMQQALNTIMGQINTQNNNPFDSGAFSPGSPFPFPMPSASGPATPAGFAGNQSQATSARTTSQSTITVDIPSTKVEAAASAPDINVKEEVGVKNEPKKSDVSPEETVQKNAFERFKDVDESSSFKEACALAEASQNGAPFNQGFGNSPGSLSARK